MAVKVGSQNAAWRDDPLPYLAGALLFAAILFGGGGAEGPLQNGILEGLGALLLCAVAASNFGGDPLPRASAPLLWLMVAALTLVLCQLIPLPPEIWADLPGREVAVAVDLLVDNRLGWRPLSLDPEATRRAAAGLLLPLPIALVAIGASRQGLLFMLRALLAAALVSAALGAAQLALAWPAALAPYGAPVATASGVFANTNHHASLLLAALIASGILVRLDDPSLKIKVQSGNWRLHLGWLLIPVFSIIAIAAASRAGWFLLVPALAMALLIAVGRRRFAWVLTLSLLALGSVGVVLLAGSPSRIGDLQALLQDSRLISLPDILFTLQQFWPVGSGLGTFVPVFKANENLDLVTSAYLNHAHNDLLELLIETGIVGAILLAVALTAVLIRLWKGSRSGSSTQATAALGGASILALLLLHSLVDYPLRADAVAAVAGVAIGLLMTKAEKTDVRRSARSSRRIPRGFSSQAVSRAG